MLGLRKSMGCYIISWEYYLNLIIDKIVRVTFINIIVIVILWYYYNFKKF